MKPSLRIFAVGLALAVPAVFAQGQTESSEGGLEVWKWANFIVLVIGLGYLVIKNAGPFFDARTKKIREDMAQADEMWKAAEARAAEVERKLATLESEIAAFRNESQIEALNETKRMKLQTAAEIARIKEHAGQEIAAAGKATRLELQRYAAHLAIGLAEDKSRGRMTADTQDALVREFVRDLGQPSSSRN